MGATYAAPYGTAKNRLRRAIADRAAPFRYQDEELAAELADRGFSGDPVQTSAVQPLPELDAAIALLEGEYLRVGFSKTIKQGTVSRTDTGLTAQGVEGLLTALRRRRSEIVGMEAGDYGGPVVMDGFAEEVRPCPGYGFPTR